MSNLGGPAEQIAWASGRTDPAGTWTQVVELLQQAVDTAPPLAESDHYVTHAIVSSQVPPEDRAALPMSDIVNFAKTVDRAVAALQGST